MSQVTTRSRHPDRARVGVVRVAVAATAMVVVALAGCSAETTTTPTAAPTLVTTTTAAPSTTVEPSTSVAPATSAPTTTLPPTTTTTTLPDPLPPADVLRGVALDLEKVADLDEVTGLAWRAGDDGLYVAGQRGQVHRVAGGLATLVLDLSSETTVVEPGSERGLLGIAFDPRDGRMYLNFTGRDNHTRVVSFEVRNGVAALPSRREVLFVEQPGVGHNGGRLVFDDEGHLFIGMGDGGGSRGRDAQDPTKILGAILRVLPRLDGDGYDIPPDNPFADGVADRPEVWARGFRNPWMFSLDRATGDMWIGDVGNDEIEEIDLIPAGQSGLNFGWYFFEGSKPRYNQVPSGMTPPVYEYGRNRGNAVMGGYVYRGSAIPALRGAYVFGDVSGAVYALGADDAVRLDVDDIGYLFGWGEDPSGELYLFSMGNGLFRLVPG